MAERLPDPVTDAAAARDADRDADRAAGGSGRGPGRAGGSAGVRPASRTGRLITVIGTGTGAGSAAGSVTVTVTGADAEADTCSATRAAEPVRTAAEALSETVSVAPLRDAPAGPHGGTTPPGPHVGRADLVVGAARHLAAAQIPPEAERLVLGPLAPALDTIARYVRAGRPVTVLASGDPGFFGIVRALGERFGPAALDVRPSAPSVAVAFARLGLAWDDAIVVSAHGRDLRTAVNVCRAHRKTAVLTGPGAGPAELGAALADAGVERTLVVACALGTPAESVVRLSPAQAARRGWPAAVSVVLCLGGARKSAAGRARTVAGPGAAPAGWALPEDQFAHRDSMVTKAEVRALVLARLGPRTGELVWDVGAGSGSVAVECARFGAAVVAVERDPRGAARVRANAAAHGVDVQVVRGSAPGVLPELPEPDAVFIGGGGRELPAIVAGCAHRARRCVVVTLAAVDRVGPVREALRAAGLATEGVLLQSARLAPLPGEVSRLAAANPVFVLWGTRPVARGGDEGSGQGGARNRGEDVVR